MIKDKYFTTQDAATLVGVTADHIRLMIRQGKLKAEKVGRNWFLKQNVLKGITRQRKPKET